MGVRIQCGIHGKGFGNKSMQTCKTCGGEIIFRFVNGTKIAMHLSGGCSGQINPSPVTPKAGSSRCWTIATLTEPITYQTQCWWCGRNVFYHTNGNSDHVLFDKIGWPWEIHHCWTEHVADQKRGLREIERRLQRANYDGQKYSITVQEWGALDWEEASGVGFVIEIKISAAPIVIDGEPNALPCCETIIKQENYFYRLLFPFRYTGNLRMYSIVKYRGKRILLDGKAHIWDPNLQVIFYPSEKAISLASIAEQFQPDPNKLDFI